MGIVQGFIGGAGAALNDAGTMLLKNKLLTERDDAEFLRDKELQGTRLTHREKIVDKEIASTDKRHTERMEHEGTMQTERIGAQRNLQIDDQAWKSIENDMDRASAENIALNKYVKPQLIKYTDSKGYEQEGVLEAKADGSFRIVKPDNSEVVVDNITREELKNAAAKINTEKGGGYFGRSRAEDFVPGNEVGFKSNEARARAAEERGERKMGAGIVGSAATPPAAPATEGKAPYPDGTELEGPDGKTYVVKNGKPVLKKQ